MDYRPRADLADPHLIRIPNLTVGNPFVSIFITARSLSVPSEDLRDVRYLSARLTLISSASRITWELVTITRSREIMNPDPIPGHRSLALRKEPLKELIAKELFERMILRELVLVPAEKARHLALELCLRRQVRPSPPPGRTLHPATPVRPVLRHKQTRATPDRGPGWVSPPSNHCKNQHYYCCTLPAITKHGRFSSRTIRLDNYDPLLRLLFTRF